MFHGQQHIRPRFARLTNPAKIDSPGSVAMYDCHSRLKIVRNQCTKISKSLMRFVGTQQRTKS